MGIKGFFGKLGKRGHATAVEETPQPDRPLPSASLVLDDPLDGLSAGFLFPLAFSVGSVPVRARPLRLEASAGAQNIDGPWFFWKAETPSGKLGGFWLLPGPSGDAAAMEAWRKTASALASAAAIKLKETLAASPGLVPDAFSAGPCKAPVLGGKPLFRADFRYAARGGFREGSAYASAGYPLIVGSSLGIALEDQEDDPLGTMLACSRAMLTAAPERVWHSRAFMFKNAALERSYLPIYELFNLLSDQDLRLVIQNSLAAGAQSETLGSLILYKSPARTDNGLRERTVPPHSFDRERVDPLLPATVFEDGRLDPVNAAPDLRAFLQRNDEAYEDLFRALRKDTLALSGTGAAIIRSIYVALVYAPKRREFDGFVSAREPMMQLRGFAEHLARRAVDTSGAKTLAAATYGSAEDLEYIARWCSSRKREAIADELKRLDLALSEGMADLESVIADRFAVLEKARAAADAAAREGKPK